MKILILCKKFPYPLKEGEPIAVYTLSQAFSKLGCEVSLLVLNTTKHYFEPAYFPAEQNHFKNIWSVKVDNSITLLGAASCILQRKSYLLSRFYSKEYEVKLLEILQANSFDVIQLETIYLTHYIPDIKASSKAVIALRSHNVEHQIWARVAQLTRNLFKKAYLVYENNFLRAFELQNINLVDLLVSITKPDLDYFINKGFTKIGLVAPAGIHLDDYNRELGAFSGNASIAFIGALDWMPNQHGIIWFIENVWPVLASNKPELTLHIAGKNTPNWLMSRAKERVIIHGEVPNAKEFLNEHPIMIAPLFSGSGIKIKVLEGMALGRVVVTTTVGLEGIRAQIGKEVLVADSKESMIEQIITLIDQPKRMKELGDKGREFIRQNYDNLDIAQSVINEYIKLIEANKVF